MNMKLVLPMSSSIETGKRTLCCTNELNVPDNESDFWPTLFNKFNTPRGAPRYLKKSLFETSLFCTKTPRKQLTAGALHFLDYLHRQKIHFFSYFQYQLPQNFGLLHGNIYLKELLKVIVRVRWRWEYNYALLYLVYEGGRDHHKIHLCYRSGYHRYPFY